MPRPHGRKQSSARNRFGELRAELHEVAVGAVQECAPAQQALEVKVSVVLPGVADTAEDLDGCVTDGGKPAGERLRRQLPRFDLSLGGGSGPPRPS